MMRASTGYAERGPSRFGTSRADQRRPAAPGRRAARRVSGQAAGVTIR
jgi:hypothetical protein